MHSFDCCVRYPINKSYLYIISTATASPRNQISRTFYNLNDLNGTKDSSDMQFQSILSHNFLSLSVHSEISSVH